MSQGGKREVAKEKECTSRIHKETSGLPIPFQSATPYRMVLTHPAHLPPPWLSAPTRGRRKKVVKSWLENKLQAYRNTILGCISLNLRNPTRPRHGCFFGRRLVYLELLGLRHNDNIFNSTFTSLMFWFDCRGLFVCMCVVDVYAHCRN